jgi:hypothetical protein
MKNSNYILAAVLAGVLLVFGWCRPAAAQEPAGERADEKAPAPMVVPLGVGTAFNATLTTELDARRNKAGDTFTAEISEPVQYQRSVIFPKGTLLIGRLVRATAGGRRQRGSGLFLQFEKAVLKSGEEAALNAGIQAISVPQAAELSAPAAAAPELPANSEAVEDVSTVRPAAEPAVEKATVHVIETSRTKVAPRNELLDASKLNLPMTQGSFTKQGLFTPDSQGVFGLPDVKLYTPLSQGSNGSVLLSGKKNVRIPAGTKLLVVIQPPATAPAAPGGDSN